MNLGENRDQLFDYFDLYENLMKDCYVGKRIGFFQSQIPFDMLACLYQFELNYTVLIGLILGNLFEKIQYKKKKKEKEKKKEKKERKRILSNSFQHLRD